MNAGFSNLETLKRHVLGPALAEEVKFDEVLKQIGLGMAGLIDTFCNRKLGWGEGVTQIFTGDRDHYYLERYPVAAVAKIEMRYFMTDAWTEITAQPTAWNPESGLIHFGYTLGRNPLQVRVTWTGGYWFETRERRDAGYGTLPAATSGADIEQAKFLLPASVQTGWLMQCAEVWNKRDKLGMGTVDKPDEQTAASELRLIPIVKQMLQPFIRYQLT